MGACQGAVHQKTHSPEARALKVLLSPSKFGPFVYLGSKQESSKGLESTTVRQPQKVNIRVLEVDLSSSGESVLAKLTLSNHSTSPFEINRENLSSGEHPLDRECSSPIEHLNAEAFIIEQNGIRYKVPLLDQPVNSTLLKRRLENDVSHKVGSKLKNSNNFEGLETHLVAKQIRKRVVARNNYAKP